jgi:hypothetical protein
MPTGTLTLMNGSTTLAILTLPGTAALDLQGPSLQAFTVTPSGGVSVTFSTSNLPLGTDVITAIYSGDSKYAPSTSSVFKEVVALTITPPTSTAVAATPSLASIGSVTVAKEHSKKSTKKVVVSHKAKPSGGAATKFHHKAKSAAIKHSHVTATVKHAKASVKKK